MDRPRYRLLDHTADLAFAVESPDWAGLLAAATGALGDVILAIDPGEVATEERPVAVEGADREEVLVAWLSEAIVLLETERFLVRGARVTEAGPTAARGALLGRRLDLRTEAPDRVPKAVTHHDLHVREGPPWRAAIVLDL